MALFCPHDPCPLGLCLPLARSGHGASNRGWLLRLALASEVALLVQVPHYHGQSLTPPDIERSFLLRRLWLHPQHGQLSMRRCWKAAGGAPQLASKAQMDQLRGAGEAGTQPCSTSGHRLSPRVPHLPLYPSAEVASLLQGSRSHCRSPKRKLLPLL